MGGIGNIVDYVYFLRGIDERRKEELKRVKFGKHLFS